MIILCSKTGGLEGWLDLSARASEHTLAKCLVEHTQTFSTEGQLVKIHVDGIYKRPAMNMSKSCTGCVSPVHRTILGNITGK